MVSPVKLFTASCARKVVQTQPVSMTEPEVQKAPDIAMIAAHPPGILPPVGVLFTKNGAWILCPSCDHENSRSFTVLHNLAWNSISCKTALKLSAVLLDGRLDGAASLGQISWHHHRMYLNARIERQEPRLGNRGDL